MEIIKADEAWIEEILQLESECISPPWTHGQMLSEVYNDDTDFTLARENGVIAGFCVVRKIGDEAELFRIATSLGIRRQGIGETLLKAAIESARSSGVSKMFLEVRVSNTEAISLYEKLGFTSIGTRRAYYEAPAEDAAVMVLEVPG